MFKNKSVSLVLPTYNEEENVGRAVTSFKKEKIFDEIIIVDNNSTDKTAKFSKKAGAKVVTEKKQGYGYALIKGMKSAKGDYVVLCEPDATFQASDAKKLLVKLKKFDCVFGTRTNKNFIKKGANMGTMLRFANIALSKLIHILFGGPRLSDCGCTYRAMKKSVVKKILPKLFVGGSHFLPDLTINIITCGFSVKEIPVHYARRVGQSKITGSWKKTFKVGANMFFLVIKMKIQNSIVKPIGPRE